MMPLRLQRIALLVLVATCSANCTRDNTPDSRAVPVNPIPEPAAEDAAVAYANRVTKTGPTYSEGYFEYEGLRLHYVEAGEGDLVILYHGFPSYWLSFLDQMEALKPRYRVVAVDGLGAGLSDKPDTLSAYRVEALAAQLDALARHLAGDEKFTLIGHDWGGALALTFAEAYPDRLKGVVGMSAPSYNVFLDLVKSSEEQQAASSYMQRIRETPPEAVVEDPPGASASGAWATASSSNSASLARKKASCFARRSRLPKRPMAASTGTARTCRPRPQLLRTITGRPRPPESDRRYY